MELNLKNLDKILDRVDSGPQYDVEKLRRLTIEDSKWVAFGSGNIFRAYIASLNQQLINRGLYDRGINMVVTRGRDNIEEIYGPSDNLALSVSLNKKGDFHTELIASIAEAIYLPESIERIEEIFTNKNLQVASFIITEKGYNIYDSSGDLSDSVKKDLEGHPKDSDHLMVNMVHFLHIRFKKNLPISLLSLDNLSKNGTVLKKNIIRLAEEYVARGYYEKEFVDYLHDETKLSYPWTMIDKITPAASEEVAGHLEKLGFTNIRPIPKAGGGLPLSKYVNAEEVGYLAIEDKFTNGRPPFEELGVYVTDGETVDKIETMKVTACLNPLHTSLAVFGCLLGYTKISDEMSDEDLVRLVSRMAYKEALPVVEDPKIINPQEFVREVIEERFPNPYLPDSPQRIATDTSLKIPVRYGKTLSTYLERGLSTENLTFIPLSLAGWLRYLLAVDDEGREFTLSSDPMLDELQGKLEGLSLGNYKETEGLRQILENEKIFGVSLKGANLVDKILAYFEEMLAGPGAVRATIQKYTR